MEWNREEGAAVLCNFGFALSAVLFFSFFLRSRVFFTSFYLFLLLSLLPRASLSLSSFFQSKCALSGTGRTRLSPHGNLPSAAAAPLRHQKATTESSSSPVVAVSASSSTPPSAAGISPPAVGSHFLHVDDWSREKLDLVLATAQEVKAIFKSKDAQDFKPLAGKTMAMIFTKPSMRTRVSFETVSSVCSFNVLGWI